MLVLVTSLMSNCSSRGSVLAIVLFDVEVSVAVVVGELVSLVVVILVAFDLKVIARVVDFVVGLLVTSTVVNLVVRFVVETNGVGFVVRLVVGLSVDVDREATLVIFVVS